MSHGQPRYNFCLSVQVFGCPYTWNKVLVLILLSFVKKIHVLIIQNKFPILNTIIGQTYKGEFWLQIYIYGCPLDNCISIFGCLATVLVVHGARTTKISNADLHTCKNIILGKQFNLHFIKKQFVAFDTTS